MLLSLLATAFPFTLANPGWYLRVADTAVSNSPVLLLSVLALLLAHIFLSDDESPDEIMRLTDRLTGTWALVFALVVPLQVIAYGWLWIASGSQLNAQFQQAESRMASLRSQIKASRTEAELQRILSATNNRTAPLIESGSLSKQKQRINQTISSSLMNLRTNLNVRRKETLAGSLPGTIKTAIGAAIVSSILYTIKREMWTGQP